MRRHNRLMQGSLLSLVSLSLAVFLVGCSDNATEKSNKGHAAAPTAGAIEIISNENAHEVKVKEKVRHKSDNDSYYYDYNIKSEYDQNAQPANKDASVRIKPRTAVEANMNVRSPYEHVQVSLLVTQLSKNFRVKCSACHDDYANGIIGPSLIGRDADYIYNKINQFKSGEKSNPLMNDLIHMMSDAEIREISEEIYHFNQELEKIRSK